MFDGSAEGDDLHVLNRDHVARECLETVSDLVCAFPLQTEAAGSIGEINW